MKRFVFIVPALLALSMAAAKDPGAAAREYRDRINEARRAGPRAPSSAPPLSPLLDEIALGLHAMGAVRFGDFTLKSGKKSPIYIDLRLLVSDPVLMAKVARVMGALIIFSALSAGRALFAKPRNPPRNFPRTPSKPRVTRGLRVCRSRCSVLASAGGAPRPVLAKALVRRAARAG